MCLDPSGSNTGPRSSSRELEASDFREALGAFLLRQDKSIGSGPWSEFLGIQMLAIIFTQCFIVFLLLCMPRLASAFGGSRKEKGDIKVSSYIFIHVYII